MDKKEVLDRRLYKKIKSMDRKTMEAFLNEIHNTGRDNAFKTELDMDALKADIGKVKGIGESRLKEITDIIEKHLNLSA